MIQGNQDGETQAHSSVLLEGGDGNDRITGINNANGQYLASGNAGNDLINMGSGHTTRAVAYGGDDNDLIYGASSSGAVTIFGDTDYGYGIGPSLTSGGEDKIYGGDDNTGDVNIYGQADDDLIFTGSDNQSVYVFGDGDCLGGGTDCHGDDIIQVEDGNMDVRVYGYGGDDKIIGGITIGIEKFYGLDGDDKIWMIHPNRRSLDAAGASLDVGTN